MPDMSARRVSVYRSDRAGLEHGSQGQAEAFGLESFDWLDAQLDTCVTAVARALTEVARSVLRTEITLETRASALERPGSEAVLRRDVALVIRLVVQGTRSLVPVIWQLGTPSWPPASLVEDLPRELLLEVRGAAEGVPLEAPLRCPVVLDPWPASQLIHECIGHTSEADNFLEYARPAGFDVGHRWTEVPLEVVDDPLLPGFRGSYTTDDEGEPAARTRLVSEGVWVGLLHNHATAAASGAARGGNGRRVMGARETLPRMSITYAEAGRSRVEDLIGQISEGLYCAGAWGGGSVGRRFILRPAYGRRIRDGQLTDTFVRRFDFRGDKFEAVGQLAGVGNVLRMFDPAFGCDKFGQNELPVSFGAPHLSLRALDLHPIRR
jgi:predicted Zn-dependent protease